MPLHQRDEDLWTKIQNRDIRKEVVNLLFVVTSPKMQTEMFEDLGDP